MTSTIGVKKIQHTNGTQVMTFDTAGKISSNVSSTGNITTTGTVNTPSINGGQIGGRRNIIINGAMQIAQRNTTQASIGGNQAYWTLDRYYLNAANTDGRLTMSQSAITDLEGFSNALKLDCTTADTSIAAGEVLILQQRVEGFNVQQLKATSTSTRAFTLSFYAKSNASRAIVSEINLTNGTNRQISKLHTIGTSWARYTMTIPAASSTQIDNDNSHELSVNFWLHAGSTYTSGTLNDDALDSITNANRAAGIGSFFSSTDNTFEITGIQLELGETATAFEHRSFGEELDMCHRYFQQFARTTANSFRIVLTGNGGTNPLGGFTYPKTMRAAPTANYFGSNTDGGNFNVNTPANGSLANSGPSYIVVADNTLLWNFACPSGAGSTPAWIDCGTQTNGFGWTLDAEL